MILLRNKVVAISQVVAATLVGLQIFFPTGYDIALGVGIMGVMYIATKVKR